MFGRATIRLGIGPHSSLIQHFAQPGCVTMVDLPVLPAVKQEKLSLTVCSGELDLRLKLFKLIGCNITSSVKE